MNTIFGGIFSEEQKKNHFKQLKQISQKYLSYYSEEIAFYSENINFCALKGLNKGIGIYKDANIIVFLDGEIYNPESLKLPMVKNNSQIRDLWAAGIAKKYFLEPSNFLDNLDGMFALVVFDCQQKKIILARDSKGYRMLYYSNENNNFVFGTHLYSVAKLSNSEIQIKKELEPFHLIYGFCPKENTIIEGIKKVRPGYWLSYEIDKKSITENKIYFEKQRNKNTPASITEAKKLLYDSFMESLDKTTHYDNKVAVLLGGLDSAAVAAGLKRLGRYVETYTFKWPKQKFNQDNLEHFQKHTGIKHHWIPMDLDFVRNRLYDMYDYIDEPRSELTYLICTTAACGVARRDGFSIVATGDEAESVIGGYPTIHNRIMIIKKLKNLPKSILKKLIKILESDIFISQFGHAARNLLTMVRKAELDDNKSYFLIFRLFDENEILKILKDIKFLNIQEINTYIENILAEYQENSPIALAHRGNENHSASIRYKHAGPSGIYDTALTSPFLYKKFAQTIQSFDKNILYPKGYENHKNAKWLFREMVKDYGLLPEAVSDQKKTTPGNSPIDYWLKKDFRQEALDIIANLPENFSQEYIKTVFKNKYGLEIYRRLFGISAVTSHAQQALLGYSLFWSNLKKWK